MSEIGDLSHIDDRDREELPFLRDRALALGLKCGIHREYDRNRPGADRGPFWINSHRKFGGETISHLRYASADKCWTFLNRYARERNGS